MSEILTSLHGRRVGLDNQDRLISLGGFLSGTNHRQFMSPSPDAVVWLDDFLGDVLADEWNVHAGSDSPSGAAISANVGGTLVLTTGDSNASLAADGIVVDGGILNWKSTTGWLVFQARLKISAITAVQAFWGLTDQFSALEMPVTLSGTTFTTVATDAVGFMFDTTATTATIRMVGVANDVDATMQTTGSSWAADTYNVYRIAVDSSGNANFYIDGVQVGTTMSGAVTPTVALTPVFGARSLAANSKTMTVDYSYVAAKR